MTETSSETLRLICTDCGNAFYVASQFHWKTVCRFCYRHEARAKDENTALVGELQRLRAVLDDVRQSKVIGGKRLKQLIGLCHPDKHGSSQMANDVTQWLLSLRGD